MCPISVLDTWKDTPEESRKEQEAKMQTEWKAWMMTHGSHVTETAGAGKTKRVSSSGTEDIRNNVMLYSIVEAETHEAVAEMFAQHPHLQIPESTIEIMEANMLPGMQ